MKRFKGNHKAAKKCLSDNTFILKKASASNAKVDETVRIATC